MIKGNEIDIMMSEVTCTSCTELSNEHKYRPMLGLCIQLEHNVINK